MAKKKIESELDKLNSECFDCMMEITYISQDIKALEQSRSEALTRFEGINNMIELEEAKRDGVKVN